MIIACNTQGIGSRLKGLISSMRIDETKVLWHHNWKARCTWNELYENDMAINRVPKGAVKYPGWKFNLRPLDKQVFCIKNADWMFHKTPELLKQDLLAQLNKLILVNKLRLILKNCRAMIDDRTIACCIRTWKDTVGKGSYERKMDWGSVWDAVEKLEWDSIFLTSDSEVAFRNFCARYGKKKIKCLKKKYGWGVSQNLAGMYDTMIELYTPGIAKNMVVSWMSAWTEMQWWCGGAKSNVYEVSRWK